MESHYLLNTQTVLRTLPKEIRNPSDRDRKENAGKQGRI